jgi:hypothetical protein
MLLTALCVKYDEGRRLPQDFYALYDAVVRQVLHKRYATENERSAGRNRLAAIALGMHRGEAGRPGDPEAEVTVEEVDRILAELARPTGPPSAARPRPAPSVKAAVRFRPAAAPRQPARCLLPPQLSGVPRRPAPVPTARAAAGHSCPHAARRPGNARCVSCSAPSPSGVARAGDRRLAQPAAILRACRPRCQPRPRWCSPTAGGGPREGWCIDEFKAPLRGPASMPCITCRRTCGRSCGRSAGSGWTTDRASG